jgi:hypothetical protein
MTQPFIVKFFEDLKNILFVISIKDELRNQNQVWSLLSDHNKFKFQNGLLYHDGLLYALDGHVQL